MKAEGARQDAPNQHLNRPEPSMLAAAVQQMAANGHTAWLHHPDEPGKPYKVKPDGIDGALELLELDSSIAVSYPIPGVVLPEVIVTDRPLREVSADALNVLVEANNPPAIFTRGDRIVRVQAGDTEEPARIVMLGEHHLRGHLTRAADFIRVDATGNTSHGSPPRDLVFDLLTLDAWPFPRLLAVIHSPVLRPDGTILDRAGYDPATGLYYDPPTGFQLPAIPSRPTRAEVAAAVELLADAFTDFPYEDDASRANALALLLTPVVRPVIAGQVPLALLDAPTLGTGKGLHAEVVSVIATGGTAAVTSAPKAEEEFRKRITSTLMRGQPVVLLDNLEGPLASSSLAAAITAPVWQDRQLGENRLVTVPARVTWMATGNNVRLRGDLPRRAYWIRLDAQVAQPCRRNVFRHNNLVAYVRAQRGQLLGALFTLVRAWDADGRPAESVPRLAGADLAARRLVNAPNADGKFAQVQSILAEAANLASGDINADTAIPAGRTIKAFGVALDTVLTETNSQ